MPELFSSIRKCLTSWNLINHKFTVARSVDVNGGRKWKVFHFSQVWTVDEFGVDVNTFKVPLISKCRKKYKCDNLTVGIVFQTFFLLFNFFCTHVDDIFSSISISSYQQNNEIERSCVTKRCLCILKCCWQTFPIFRWE